MSTFDQKHGARLVRARWPCAPLNALVRAFGVSAGLAFGAGRLEGSHAARVSALVYVHNLPPRKKERRSRGGKGEGGIREGKMRNIL